MLGAVLAKAKKKTARVDFMADREWVERAIRAAKRWELNLSAFIRLAVNEKIERDGEPPQMRRPPSKDG